MLGEIVAQTLAAGRPAEHRQGLGNTGILEQALASGAIDLYPEYTGTIVRELLKRDGNPSLDELNGWLAPRGLKAAVPFGFNNTYALAMTRDEGARRCTSRASPTCFAGGARRCRLGLSHEFLERGDGWPALRAGLRRRRTRRRSGSTTAWPTTPSPPAGSTSSTSTRPTPSSAASASPCSRTTARFFPRYDAVAADARRRRSGAARAARRRDRRARP